MSTRNKTIDSTCVFVGCMVIMSVLRTLLECYGSFFIYNYSINCLEPFIAVSNTWEIIPLTIAGTFFNMIMLKRKGEEKGVRREIYDRFMYSGLFVVAVAILLFLTVIPVSYVGHNWSFSCVKNLIGIPVYLYTQKTAGMSFVYSFLLVYALINLCSLIVDFCAIIKSEVYGFFVLAILFSLNWYSYYTGYIWKWILPLSNANLAEHYEAIYIGSVFPLWYSFLYFIILYLLISFLIQGYKHKTIGRGSNDYDTKK